MWQSVLRGKLTWPRQLTWRDDVDQGGDVADDGADDVAVVAQAADILRLEFSHYDYKSRGTISAKDFALSMVASANMRHINKFLDRVDELDDEPCLRDIRITFEEFKNFAELRKKLQPLCLAIFSYGKVNGLLTKEDFQRAAYQVCGIPLTDNVVDMIFYIFDANRDGNLSSDEFLTVLQRRGGDNPQAREAGFMGLISCWLECTNNCAASKILL
ncbi:hypothetical protein F0562_030234 [Nyssa sinensis]|uniref:EF-hand domain-containing protein n=1 Tax=Nyssa sinensis TaxID=561372 RepID=A0A5J5B282_9ASTE|nr:hypothetical protein F0562_030234 [Nyssa sinensis]